VSELILAEVDRLLACADDHGVALRLLGSVAVWAHCDEHRSLLGRLERQEYRDIDLMGRSGERQAIGEVFAELGYEPDAALLGSQEYGINRFIFHSRPPRKVKVDVFLDTLRMCHRIDMADRLQLDRPTVSLADLLLSKLQIVRLTENDIKDCTVLVAEHPFGLGDLETFDLQRIVRILAEDWGFWYTVTSNIVRIRSSIRSASVIPVEIVELADERLGELLGALESAPKSLRWRARKSIGTRVLWYEEVEDVER
jgi:hypothetical protein